MAFLFSISEALEDYALTRGLRALLDLVADRVTVRRDGGELEIEPVALGDLMIVRPYWPSRTAPAAAIVMSVPTPRRPRRSTRSVPDSGLRSIVSALVRSDLSGDGPAIGPLPSVSLVLGSFGGLRFAGGRACPGVSWLTAAVAAGGGQVIRLMRRRR